MRTASGSQPGAAESGENLPALPAAGIPLLLLTHEDGSYLLDWSAATYTIKAPGTSASGQSGWEEATGVIVTDGSDLTAGITVGASAAQELASSRTCSRS